MATSSWNALGINPAVVIARRTPDLADGICDDVDDCVGAYDACGICNGIAGAADPTIVADAPDHPRDSILLDCDVQQASKARPSQANAWYVTERGGRNGLPDANLRRCWMTASWPRLDDICRSSATVLVRSPLECGCSDINNRSSIATAMATSSTPWCECGGAPALRTPMPMASATMVDDCVWLHTDAPAASATMMKLAEILRVRMLQTSPQATATAMATSSTPWANAVVTAQRTPMLMASATT